MPTDKYQKLIALGGFLLLTINLGAWSIADSYSGNLIHSFNARNQAMGNSGVYDNYGAASILTNPANLSMLPGTAGLQVNAIFTSNDETRSFPLYNSFDTFIDDATYSSNLNLYDDYGFAGYGKYQVEFLTAGLGLHYLPLYDFCANYDEEIRNINNSDNDGYPEMIALNRISNKGRLNSLGGTLSCGMDLPEGMEAHVGCTFSMLKGTVDRKTSIRWTEWAINQSIEATATGSTAGTNVLPDSSFTYNTDLSGTQIKIGTDLKVNSRLGLGIAYTPKTKVDLDATYHVLYKPFGNDGYASAVDVTHSYKDTYTLPSRLRFGFNYQPRNIMRTSFNAELEYVSWKECSEMYEDAWDMHVGVEHKIENRVPLRLGFQSVTDWLTTPDFRQVNADFSPSFNTIKVITPSITAGSSVAILKNLSLDLGLSFGWREYETLDLFRDSYYYNSNIPTPVLNAVWDITTSVSHFAPTDRDWTNPDKVRESFVNIASSLTWNW